MEIFPLYYQQILRKSYFRLNFESNCLKKIDVHFEIDYGNNKLINWNFHPTTVNLKLWDNFY